MAVGTESYQILRGIVSQVASPLNVVNLETLHSSARLATPTISLQNLAAKLAICFRAELNTRPLRMYSSQRVT
jgi:hypothetical protein